MGVGPYYAMFPMKFAFDIVQKYSQPGEWVLDPFAGRASSVYAAAAQERHGIGIEINPVGWLYGHVKLRPANKVDVLRRIDEIAEQAVLFSDEAKDLPEFFHWCFGEKALKFLLSARHNLCWKNKIIDATLMTIILIDLHGRLGNSFSNQMRQSKAMSPEYSIRWWKERNLEAPDIEPTEFLQAKLKWRYAHEPHKYKKSHVILGDSTTKLKKLKKQHQERFSLLLTSPPYYEVTNYHYDQWLRLWMLGGSSYPDFSNKGTWQKKFESRARYRQLLTTVFSESKHLLSKQATIYIRTDKRKFTHETTMEVMRDIFPDKRLNEIQRPLRKPSQTALYGDKSPKPGEVDIILTSP